jgi:AmmeMemoRadiSam system protein B/AmmeMemoRadiSam system protein A
VRQICSIIGLLLAFAAIAPAAPAARIQEAAVAGAFYPADAAVLKNNVDGLLSAVTPGPHELLPMALISPHAGYVFSGSVAAEGYARLKGRAVSTVILIGPSHHAPLNGAAIYPGDGMRTPLGVVAVNKRLARALSSDPAHVRLNAAPFEKEHSLEVQLPFIQRALGQKVRIVPILVGRPDPESFAFLTNAIARVLKDDPTTLLVISTDLSHYHDQAAAQVLDSRVIDAMERLSRHDLEQLLGNGRGEMCGGWPVVYGLSASRAAGATHAISYRRATSGDVNDDRRRVVGYVSMGIVRGELSVPQKQKLLGLARSTVRSHVRGEKLPVASGADQLLRADGAAFVTLNEANGTLRGCIGTILPQTSLQESVIQNAVSAASRDQRFPPVRPDELAGLHVEVTVLSALEPLSDVNGIILGRHGVYLEKEGRSSVFLPQVPVEQGWDLPTYLSQLALKAGLPPDGWRGARLCVFTAEIIK